MVSFETPDPAIPEASTPQAFLSSELIVTLLDLSQFKFVSPPLAIESVPHRGLTSLRGVSP